MIRNEAKIKGDSAVNAVRAQAENRAQWLYLIVEEAEKMGMDIEKAARDGIFRCGCIRGEEMFSQMKDRTDLLELSEYYKRQIGFKVFEKEFVKESEHELQMEFHHCPLLAGWQKLTDDEKKMAKLCDIAMEGDRGFFSVLPNTDFILDGTLAEGEPVCRLILRKKGVEREKQSDINSNA